MHPTRHLYLILTLTTLYGVFAMVINPFRACEGPAILQEEYRRGDYVPQFIKKLEYYQILSPDTPYVAAIGPRHLYFIDTRFRPETAAHIKMQIERATSVRSLNSYTKIDEFEATAEVREYPTGEITFVFDPPYARVLYAAFINKSNPDIKLPEHVLMGDWVTVYDFPQEESAAEKSTTRTKDTHNAVDKSPAQATQICALCKLPRIDNTLTLEQYDSKTCHPHCGRKFDLPRNDGESDTDYYQRMDNLHWGVLGQC